MQLSEASPSPAPRSPSRRIAVGAFTFVAVLVALVIALFGAWLGTSLAVFRDGPVWLAVVGAIVCFAILPLVWELIADRKQVGGRLRDAILRSAFLSLAFTVVLLATHPQMAFKALATRGDWFLGGSHSAAAESVRGVLQDAASGLEWLYRLVRPREFDQPEVPIAESDIPSSSESTTRVVVPPSATQQPKVVERPHEDDDHVGTPTAYAIPGTTLTWPLEPVVHPAVSGMPDSAKTSIQAVGKYLAATVPDPLERVRAVHDFVATWVAYDAVGLADGSYTQGNRQAAARVFADHKGVCAGYANLMVAVGKAANVHIVYVAGDARRPSDYDELARDSTPAKGAGHAWNAAKVGDHWYLLDATWDAGRVNGTTFEREYRTAYLFIPPEAIALTHLPDNDKWQLLPSSLDRAGWLRQPLIRPEGLALGVAFADPTTPMTAADGKLTLRMDNPGTMWLSTRIETLDGSDVGECGPVVADAHAKLECDFAARTGRHVVLVFASPRHYGDGYRWVGSVFVDVD